MHGNLQFVRESGNKMRQNLSYNVHDISVKDVCKMFKYFHGRVHARG